MAQVHKRADGWKAGRDWLAAARVARWQRKKRGGGQDSWKLGLAAWLLPLLPLLAGCDRCCCSWREGASQCFGWSRPTSGPHDVLPRPVRLSDWPVEAARWRLQGSGLQQPKQPGHPGHPGAPKHPSVSWAPHARPPWNAAAALELGVGCYSAASSARPPVPFLGNFGELRANPTARKKVTNPTWLFFASVFFVFFLFYVSILSSMARHCTRPHSQLTFVAC